MLADTLHSLYSEFFGKSIFSVAEEMTGVSHSVWRTGGPKREKKLKAANENLREWLSQTLTDKNEFSDDEVLKIVSDTTKSQNEYLGVLSSLFLGIVNQIPCQWDETELLAKELDKQEKELVTLYKNTGLVAFRNKLMNLLEEGETHTWLSLFERDFQEKLNSAKSATTLEEINHLIAYWMLQAIFRFLACLDVEFQHKYFINAEGAHLFQPQPIFAYLLPRLNPTREKNADAAYASRGLFHLPLRHLLVLTFSLAYFYRHRTWPKKSEINASNISAWMDLNQTKDTLQLVKKIYRGTKGISLKEFDAIWVSMTKNGNEGLCHPSPWPIYIAAQFWTFLFVKFGKVKGEKRLKSFATVDSSVYKYWWDFYYERSESRNSLGVNKLWPNYLNC